MWCARIVCLLICIYVSAGFKTWRTNPWLKYKILPLHEGETAKRATVNYLLKDADSQPGSLDMGDPCEVDCLNRLNVCLLRHCDVLPASIQSGCMKSCWSQLVPCRQACT